ncbi:MAG: hypothetical protein EXS08_09375 [Planctomycetes bacterium]|nr:hypothetical protein [Planctomycetota bacterium]
MGAAPKDGDERGRIEFVVALVVVIVVLGAAQERRRGAPHGSWVGIVARGVGLSCLVLAGFALAAFALVVWMEHQYPNS